MARAIGRDINPVAYFLVRNALAIHNLSHVLETFHAIERDVAPKLRSFEARLPDERLVPVLNYFWVKTVACPLNAKQPSICFLPTYLHNTLMRGNFLKLARSVLTAADT